MFTNRAIVTSAPAHAAAETETFGEDCAPAPVAGYTCTQRHRRLRDRVRPRPTLAARLRGWMAWFASSARISADYDPFDGPMRL